MASSTLTSEEISEFREIAKKDRFAAIEILVKHDFINQLVLHDVIDELTD